jgi:hypothetical protein
MSDRATPADAERLAQLLQRTRTMLSEGREFALANTRAAAVRHAFFAWGDRADNLLIDVDTALAGRLSSPAEGPQPICGHPFDAMFCVAPPGHTGPHVTSNEHFPHGLPKVPRRIQMLLWCEAEHKIQQAVDAVEVMGADVRLTDAVVLLAKARERVADFVDGVPAAEGPRAPSDTTEAAECPTCGAPATYTPPGSNHVVGDWNEEWTYDPPAVDRGAPSDAPELTDDECEVLGGRIYDAMEELLTATARGSVIRNVLTGFALVRGAPSAPPASEAKDKLARAVVLWDGASEDDSCVFCSGEWYNDEPFILHAADCPVVIHRLALIDALVKNDPPADSYDGTVLAELATAQERYEKVKYPTIGSTPAPEGTPPT